MDSINSRLWKKAFDTIDEHKDHRAKLKTALKSFREKVSPIAAKIASLVPNYPDHSVTHSDRLWKIADIIAGEVCGS